MKPPHFLFAWFARRLCCGVTGPTGSLCQRSMFFRIPYWNAQWVYGLAAYGSRVVIYH